jgi:DUF1680 family protein
MMETIARNEQSPQDYPVKPVPFTNVQLNDAFWAPRIETNRAVTIPFAFRKCEETGRVDLFRRAAASLRGDESVDKSPPGYPFDDSDVYKVIEGAAYTLSVHPDLALEAYIDGLIDLIGTAQVPDGYLYPARTIDPQHPHRASGSQRWELERAHSHELYDLGHLYEAAVAYYQGTGKRALLDIALRSADLLDRTFGPGKRTIWPGHQITELALVKLYRVTGEERYLRLAEFMLDRRGPDGSEGSGKEYNQSHKRVVEQAEAVGHAVRATYMYAGMADIAALAGDVRYAAALDRIWQDVAGSKLYITGGIGATGEGEAFGQPYDLPNLTAYSETCAAIGCIFWNQRLFLLHADGRYIDLLERTLYNALLAGVSLDGKLFFYDNPLESGEEHRRSPWFGCACCPSNLARFLPSLSGYVYAQQAATIYVNLFAGSTATVVLDDGRTVQLAQETLYPWDGKVRISVNPEIPGPFALKVRIPGWASNEVVPSDLYAFAGSAPEPALSVNGRPVDLHIDRGYVTLQRGWQRGDLIALDLPMPVRRITANGRVVADRGKVALQRGPIVYCVESTDNPGENVRNLSLPDSAPLNAEFVPDLLGGVVVVRARATRNAQAEADQVDITAIPYFAWANRGPGAMAVWLLTGGQ